MSEIFPVCQEIEGNMGPFAPSQSQDHQLARLSLDKQENEGHCEQQLCCSAGHENAGQSVNVSEKDSVLRSTGE